MTAEARGRERLVEAGRWLLPLVVVAAAYRSSLTHGFVSDAVFLIRDNRFLEHWGQLVPNLTHDYFWSSSGNHIPYWRPLTKAGWLAEGLVVGRHAQVFHAALVAWLLLGCTGVQFLARSLGASPRAAWLAALLFGLHPAVIEPASLMMATSDVACAAAATWAVAGWCRWRQSGRAGWALLHTVALALALGHKELGVVIPVLLSGWLLLERFASEGRGPCRVGSLWSLAPAWGLAGLYLVLRGLVLQERASAGLAFDPLRLFVGGAEYLVALFPLRVFVSVRDLSFAEARDPLALAGALVAWLSLGAVGAWLWRRRGAPGASMLAWAVGSLLPVLLVAEMNVPGDDGKYALSERWMIQAVAASAVVFAWVFDAARPLRGAQAAILGAAGCWLVATLWLAPTTHAPYANEISLAALEDRDLEATPERFRTLQDVCRYHDRRVVRHLAARDPEGALDEVIAVPPACPWDFDRRFNELSALVEIGRHQAALPVLEDLGAHQPPDRRTQGSLLVLAGRVHRALGDVPTAEAAFRRAQGIGAGGCGHLVALAELGAARDALDKVALAAQARACLGERTARR